MGLNKAISATEQSQLDHFWMKKALKQAQKAYAENEVPVGAIIIDSEGAILALGRNCRERKTTPLGHAELVAVHKASRRKQSWRLTGATLYVTLEPCSMCAGALVQARIGRVVFGAKDPKGGALGSVFTIGLDKKLNHTFEMTSGIAEQECSEILKTFFKKRRFENTQK